MISTVKGGSNSGNQMWNKRLDPGNHVVKLVNIRLVPAKIKDDPNAYHLLMGLESEPVGDGFEGFAKDKNDPSKGNYEGRMSYIKASPFPYYTGKTKFDKVVNRDESILAMIKTICIQTDSYYWWKKANDVYETIEEFVEAFNNDKPFEDKWIYVCIAGKQYRNENGYAEWGLFFPYSKGGKYPFCSIDGDQSKVVQFEPEVHAIKLEGEPQQKGSDDDLDVF